MRKRDLKNKWRNFLPIIFGMILLGFLMVNNRVQASAIGHDKSATVTNLKIEDLDGQSRDHILDHDRLLISLEIDNQLKELNLGDFIEIDFDGSTKNDTFLEPFEDQGKIFVNAKEYGNYNLNKRGCRLVFAQTQPNFSKAKFSFIMLAHNNSHKEQSLTFKAGNERKTIQIDNQHKNNFAVYKSGSIQGQKVQWQNLINLTEFKDLTVADIEEKVDQEQIIIPDSIRFTVEDKNYTLAEFNKKFASKVTIGQDQKEINLNLNLRQLACKSVRMTYQTQGKDSSKQGLTSETKILNTEVNKSYQFKAISPFSLLKEGEQLGQGQLLIINKLTKADKDNDLLANAKFQIKKLNPDSLQFELIGELVTDQNGLASLNNLADGIYQIRQVQVPAGILLNSKSYVAEINKEHSREIVNFVNRFEEISLEKDKSFPLPESQKQLNLADKENKAQTLSALSDSRNHRLNLNQAVDNFKKVAPKREARIHNKMLNGKDADNRNDYSESKSDRDKGHLPQAGEKAEICWVLLGCIGLVSALLINFILKKEK